MHCYGPGKRTDNGQIIVGLIQVSMLCPAKLLHGLTRLDFEVQGDQGEDEALPVRPDDRQREMSQPTLRSWIK